jgi:hypothetical protein
MKMRVSTTAAWAFLHTQFDLSPPIFWRFFFLLPTSQNVLISYTHIQHPIYNTANLIIIDARYQLSTVFSTSLLLGNRWNHDNGRQSLWEWRYNNSISYHHRKIWQLIWLLEKKNQKKTSEHTGLCCWTNYGFCSCFFLGYLDSWGRRLMTMASVLYVCMYVCMYGYTYGCMDICMYVCILEEEG